VAGEDDQIMTATQPTLPAGGEGYDPEHLFDEAFEGPGVPRDHYAAVLGALADRDLASAGERVRARLLEAGCTFGEGSDADAFPVDLVPRVIPGEEWHELACGLEQRVRALDAFVRDVYSDRRCFAEGVVPLRAVRAADYFEPELTGLPPQRILVGIAGLDVIRTADGDYQVLEDNLRTPSGLAYTFTARRVIGRLFEGTAADPAPVEEAAIALLERTLRCAAPDGCANPRIVVLTDGPANSAYWEHRTLAEALEVPLVTLDQLDTTRVDVVYRRTNDDRLLQPGGSAYTGVGAALIGGLRRGRLACVNALGNGVADDKLIHAYVEDMVRYYLGEEPLVRSVPTYDLADDAKLEEVLDRLDEMVVKPRSAYGGAGVFVGPTAQPHERDRVAREVRDAPEEWIAQETVFFSRHPTVIDGRIVPRHVDLRAFVTFDGEAAHAIPGGLTRVAFDEGELVVNSSRGGGGKDTWILPRP
jgi:carboxylate-amine ligase